MKKITRATFENLVAHLIDRTKGPCQTALKDANLGKGKINDVILVGGMTRMPQVQKKVEEILALNRAKMSARRSRSHGRRGAGGRFYKVMSRMCCCWI